MKQQPRIRQMLSLLNKAVKHKGYWRQQCQKAEDWESYDKAFHAEFYWENARVRLGQRFVEFGCDYLFEGHYVIEHKAALYR